MKTKNESKEREWLPLNKTPRDFTGFVEVLLWGQKTPTVKYMKRGYIRDIHFGLIPSEKSKLWRHREPL